MGEPDDVSTTDSFDTGYLLEHRFNDNWKLRNNFRLNSANQEEDFARLEELGESTGILSRRFSSNERLRQTYSLQTNVIGDFTTGSIEHTLLFGIDIVFN